MGFFKAKHELKVETFCYKEISRKFSYVFFRIISYELPYKIVFYKA